MQSPAALLEEAKEAYTSGVVEPETVIERYAPPLQEHGRVADLEDILDARHRSVLWSWIRNEAPDGNGVAPETPGARHPVSLAEVLEDPELLELPESVVPKVAWRGRVTMLAAREKVGKSTFARAGAAAVSTGRPFLGQTVHEGDVLWLGLEEHVGDLARGFDEFGPEPKRIRVLSRVDEPFEELRRWTAALRPRLVVVDTLAALLSREEIESGDASAWTRAMREVTEIARSTDAAIILLHHASKDGGYRDSTAIGANVDVILEMEESTTDGDVREVEARGRWTVDDYAVLLNRGEARLGFELTTSEGPLDTRILQHVQMFPGCSTRKVRQNVSGRDMEISRRLKALEKQGLVRDQGESGRSSWYPADPPETGENP